MNKKKKLASCLTVFLIIISSAFQIFNMNSIGNSEEISNDDKVLRSSDITTTKQWITNGDFSSQENWTSIKGDFGDPTDVDASISGGVANYEILGEKRTFSLVDDPPSDINWTDFTNDPFPTPNNGYGIDGSGCYASHMWNEETSQTGNTPSIHWKRNITMPVSMSDYEITSASLTSYVSGSVDVNIDVYGDPVDAGDVYDYARFYVLISDLENNVEFEASYYQTSNLGRNSGPLSLSNQLMATVDDDILIFFLTTALQNDDYNFTLTLGIDIYCEDNDDQYDHDDWDTLRIENVSLTFTYEKKIDQITSISWNQMGDKPSDLSSNQIVVDEAILNFEFKVDDTWPSASPNSEIRVLINDIPHSETVKLSEGIITFKDAKIGGFDVTSLIDENKNINTSLQVYLADEFELNRTITISIDNIYLNITYTEIIEDTATDYALYLNSENKTSDPVISIPLGEDLNITVKYLDNQTKNHISGATVQLEGKVSGNLTEDIALQQYSIIINTTDLGIGVKTLTVVAEKTDYITQNIQFFIEVSERETELLLFLNSDLQNDGDTIQVKANEFINVTVNYRDNTTKQFLSGATITLLGDLTGDLNETSGLYNITIDTDDLDQGITAFTVFAQLKDYKPQSIQFFVELIERETELLLFLNSDPKNDKYKIEVTVDELINVTVYYRDNITKQLLIGATVTLLGINNLTETSSHYNITVDPNIHLDPGITVLTVFAQLDNYRSQSIQFFVEIVEKETELLLFLDEDPKNDGDKIQVEVNEFINVTVYYRDNLTKQFLIGATITLIGRGNFTETSSHYNITVDTNDLDQGITVLTIFAQLDNYQPQSIQFFVEVIERESELDLFLDGDNMTLDPVIEVTIGNILNITVYYTDNQTGLHITGALVQLIGEGDTINFTENLNQYSISLNITELKIGVSLFTIVAHANNFQIRTIDLRITTNRIKITTSTLSGESYVTGLEGDTIKLSIILNNTNILPSGELIKNANVTFTWAYGQGRLLENDGIYEVDLDLDVPVDTYIIRIYVADEFDEYVFIYNSENGHEITLSVNIRQGLDLIWLVIIFSSVIIGLISIFGLYQKHFKYPPLVRKIRKLRKKVRKGKKIKPIALSKREEIVKENFKHKIELMELKPIKSEKGFKVQVDSKIEQGDNLQNGGN